MGRSEIGSGEMLLAYFMLADGSSHMLYM